MVAIVGLAKSDFRPGRPEKAKVNPRMAELESDRAYFSQARHGPDFQFKDFQGKMETCVLTWYLL